MAGQPCIVALSHLVTTEAYSCDACTAVLNHETRDRFELPYI